MAITWRNVEAPDATGAANILQMAGQNIGRAVAGGQQIAENQIQDITDRNVSQIAQSIINSGEGLEGLTTVKGLENQLANVDAANIGGTKGLQMLNGVLNDRRSQLETQAIDSFNDIVNEAAATGEWGKFKEAQDTFTSLVSNSAPVLDRAIGIQAQQESNRALSGLRTGQVNAKDVLNNSDPRLLGRPEYAPVLEAAANQIRTEKLGNLVRNVPTMINKVTRQGANPQAVLNGLYSGFTDKEIAENYDVLSGVGRQVQEAYTNSLNLTASEKLALDAQKQVVDNAKSIFDQENQVIKNKVVREVGGDVQAVNAYEQYKDSNLSMSEVIRQRLGEDADLDTIDNALTTLMSNQDIDIGKVSPAAMAYAFSMHPEVGDWLTDDPKAFAKLVNAAQSQIDTVANAYTKLDELLLARQKEFLNYEQKAGLELMSLSNELVSARRNNRSPKFTNVSPFEGYVDADFQRKIDNLLGKTKQPTRTEQRTPRTPVQQDAALIRAGSTTPTSVNIYGREGESLFRNVN
ncbi:MAG: hypothetical protein CMC55_06110 [Flavobacteriaceae bacterium]|nr:hypothetical protein [Flavobacteriaceae bacterium]